MSREPKDRLIEEVTRLQLNAQSAADSTGKSLCNTTIDHENQTTTR